MREIEDFHQLQNAGRAEAKNVFFGRRRIVEIHVESEADVPFWFTVFRRFAPQLDLEFIPYTRRDQSATLRFERGKDFLLKMVRESQKEKDGEAKDKKDSLINWNKLICVDSDYDYLIPDTIDGITIRENKPYIFQTYTYAIENYKCLAESLDCLCVEATYHTDLKFDFVDFLKEYSKTVYELFLCSIYSMKNKINAPITRDRFCQIASLGGTPDINNNAKQTLQKLRDNIEKALKEVDDANPGLNIKDEIKSLAADLERDHDVNHENAYLFVHGHALFKAVADTIGEVVASLIGRRYERISEETSGDEETARQLRTQYEKLIYESGIEEPSSEPKGKAKAGRKSKRLIYHPRKLLNVNKAHFYHACAPLDKIKQDIEDYLAWHPAGSTT